MECSFCKAEGTLKVLRTYRSEGCMIREVKCDKCLRTGAQIVMPVNSGESAYRIYSKLKRQQEEQKNGAV